MGRFWPRLCKNKITVSYKSILKESTLAILQTLSTMGILGRFLPGSQLAHRFYTASAYSCPMRSVPGFDPKESVATGCNWATLISPLPLTERFRGFQLRALQPTAATTLRIASKSPVPQ